MLRASRVFSFSMTLVVVALLIRRVRERSGNPKLICIGTSATMVSAGSQGERREAVAGFASKFFGVPVKAENVVEETLRRVRAKVSGAAVVTHP